MAQENGIHLFSEFFRHLSYHAKNMLLRGKEHARIYVGYGLEKEGPYLNSYSYAISEL